jgi:predicted RNA binding protein YcfA (HicA-like mRNA interferase family)
LVPLRALPYREVKRKFEAAGFSEVSQKGSHIKCVKSTEQGVWTAIVPNHRDVSLGTLRSIIRQAGLTPDEFERL